MKSSRSIKNIYLVGIISVVFISITISSFIIIFHEYQDFQAEAEQIRAEYVDKQKEKIKNEVEQALRYIEYMKSKTESRLKEDIKARTNEAIAIAQNLYNENQQKRSRGEIEKMIKDALRPIRFNNERGYYFATDLNGIVQLFADHPELEGKNLHGMKDTQGKFVIQDMIEIAKNRKEGFYRYNWTKPTEKGRDFPKIAYIKYFEPLDWFFGTGEYLDDVEEDIKKEVLQRIAKIRFGTDGYIFVVSFNGVTLMNDTQQNLIGKNIWDLTDANGVKVIQEERKAAENPEGGFIYYVWNKPTKNKPSPKVSFIKGLHEWQWMVGAGVYLDDIEKELLGRKQFLFKNTQRKLLEIILVLFFIALFIVPIAKIISNRLKNNFEIFSNFFKIAANQSVKISLNDVNVVEFEPLVESANQMIEEREKTESLLIQNEQRYKKAQHMGKVGNWEYDIVNKTFWGSEEARRIYGFDLKSKDFTTDEVEKCIPERERVHQALIDLIEKDKPYNLEFEICPINDPHRKVIKSIAEVVKSDSGEPLKVTGVIQDITQQKKIVIEKQQLEEQLQQAQKMEAIGTLAGGIAHDFNNILSPIIGYTEIMLENAAEGGDLQENLHDVLKASLRARELVQQILTFSRQAGNEQKPVKMQFIIGEVLKLMKSSLPSTITIKQGIDKNCGMVLADPTSIHQIAMNLITNSYHAMEDNGGIITIKLTEVNITIDDIKNFDLNPGKFVCFSVSDTGQGIEKHILDRIFEPYFTTKPKGKGTGLGLSVVHGIVKSYKGDIRVYSEPGKGTVFNVYLPVISSNREETNSMIHIPVQGGDEHILIVDDEEPILKMEKQILERLGYQVTTRTSSMEALEAFRSSSHKFDLIITDMTMPNMTGDKLTFELKKIRDDIPIIVCTGFSEKMSLEKADALGIDGFLMKPIVRYDLAQKIRTVLDLKKKGQNQI